MLDSGVGGISVLKEAVRQLPHEHFIFYGDTKNAPYGTRTADEVYRLTDHVVQTLMRMGAKAVVIACNTATSAAAKRLRAQYELPIIGMEPALKPAQAYHTDGVILSIATPGTIAGEKYAQLAAQYGEGVISLPCPGLMEFVERNEMDSLALHTYLRDLFLPFIGRKIEAVVLGCTHYCFLRSALKKQLPGVPLLDGNEGTVHQLIRLLAEKDALAPADQQGQVELYSSGDGRAVRQMEMLLKD